MLDRQSLVEEDLHDLKLRYELLDGDRKAYLETSQSVIRLNKDEMAKLRLRNKELRESLAKLKKPAHHDRPDPHTSDLDRFDLHISELHKKYDDMQAILRGKDDKLQELDDQLYELVKEHALIQQTTEESQSSKVTHALENRLDKANIKFNEAQLIRKVYEEIVRRLQEERLTFDAQLTHFERTLKQKHIDAAELEVMSRDANHAKELVKTELARIEEKITEDRKKREKDLSTSKELVRQKIESNESLELRLLRTGESPDDARLQANDENATLAADQKTAEYEQLSRTIKEAIGVNDLNDVVAKFQEQSATHNRLTQLAHANETKLNDLKRKRSDLMRELEEMLIGGEAKGQHARTTLNELEQRLQDEFTKSEEAVTKYERVAKVLTSAMTGVLHLRQKLTIDDDLLTTRITPAGVPNNSLIGNSVTPATLLDALALSTKRIGEMLAGVKGRAIRIDGDLASVTLQPQFNNIRVQLRPSTFEAETDEENGSADDGDDTVLDRESIKKTTMALLNAKNKPKGGTGAAGRGSGKKKSKKSKKGQESEEEMSDG